MTGRDGDKAKKPKKKSKLILWHWILWWCHIKVVTQRLVEVAFEVNSNIALQLTCRGGAFVHTWSLWSSRLGRRG